MITMVLGLDKSTGVARSSHEAGEKTSSLQKLWRAWETGDYMASEINVQNSGCERLGTGLSSNRVRRLLCLCQA